MRPFTVFGVYQDTEQRYCDTFDARDPGHAQELCLEECDSSLLIASVIEGSHTPVDREEYGTSAPNYMGYMDWVDGVLTTQVNPSAPDGQ